MPDTILVVVEQREGKLTVSPGRPFTAGQAIAAATGWTLEAGWSVRAQSSIAAEVAGKKVAKSLRRRIAEARTLHADAFAAGLKQVLAAKQPKLVLMPHTYQVRGLCPKAGDGHGAHGDQ